MSPKRGDRVTVPPPDDEWDVRFGTSEAVRGWDELCRHALSNTRRCFESLRIDPRISAGHDRQHRLRGDLATHRHNGKELEQWEFEVTSGGRVRYCCLGGTGVACPGHGTEHGRLLLVGRAAFGTRGSRRGSGRKVIAPGTAVRLARQHG